MTNEHDSIPRAKPCGRSLLNSRVCDNCTQIELRDREAQIADNHRDLSLAQGELNSTQQQVEEQLARLADERAAS